MQRYIKFDFVWFFLDWSIEATAEALSIPEGTVKTHQHRAVERLRKRLEEPL